MCAAPSRCSSTDTPVPGGCALGHLGELHRVAEQDDVPRRRPDGERVRERHLARLVDEQIVHGAVELGPANSHAVPASRRTSGSAKSATSPELSIRAPVKADSALPVDFFSPLKSTPSAAATRSISKSRLWIALWLVAVTPTRLPSRSRRTISRAPVHVFPEPGGP